MGGHKLVIGNLNFATTNFYGFLYHICLFAFCSLDHHQVKQTFQAMSEDSRPILGYWAIRGLAQPIRLLLAYTGTEFEDKMYQCGPGPAYDRSAWMDVKFTLGLDFPNLPYYMETNVKLTGTNAILRHIARKHNLCGRTREEMVRVDMAAEQVMDMRNNAVFLFYNGAGTGFDSSIGEFLIDSKVGAL